MSTLLSASPADCLFALIVVLVFLAMLAAPVIGFLLLTADKPFRN